MADLPDFFYIISKEIGADYEIFSVPGGTPIVTHNALPLYGSTNAKAAIYPNCILSKARYLELPALPIKSVTKITGINREPIPVPIEHPILDIPRKEFRKSISHPVSSTFGYVRQHHVMRVAAEARARTDGGIHISVPDLAATVQARGSHEEILTRIIWVDPGKVRAISATGVSSILLEKHGSASAVAKSSIGETRLTHHERLSADSSSLAHTYVRRVKITKDFIYTVIAKAYTFSHLSMVEEISNLVSTGAKGATDSILDNPHGEYLPGESNPKAATESILRKDVYLENQLVNAKGNATAIMFREDYSYSASTSGLASSTAYSLDTTVDVSAETTAHAEVTASILAILIVEISATTSAKALTEPAIASFLIIKDQFVSAKASIEAQVASIEFIEVTKAMAKGATWSDIHITYKELHGRTNGLASTKIDIVEIITYLISSINAVGNTVAPLVMIEKIIGEANAKAHSETAWAKHVESIVSAKAYVFGSIAGTKSLLISTTEAKAFIYGNADSKLIISGDTAARAAVGLTFLTSIENIPPGSAEAVGKTESSLAYLEHVEAEVDAKAETEAYIAFLEYMPQGTVDAKAETVGLLFSKERIEGSGTAKADTSSLLDIPISYMSKEVKALASFTGFPSTTVTIYNTSAVAYGKFYGAFSQSLKSKVTSSAKVIANLEMSALGELGRLWFELY